MELSGLYRRERERGSSLFSWVIAAGSALRPWRTIARPFQPWAGRETWTTLQASLVVPRRLKWQTYFRLLEVHDKPAIESKIAEGWEIALQTPETVFFRRPRWVP